MADEYRLDEFFKAKMTAEARSGSDPRSSRGFGRTYVYENVRRAAEYERASARWDAFKSSQEAEGYETAWRAFQRAKEPADHRAPAELHRAIKIADEAYHTELARLGRDILSWFGRFLFATAGQFCRSAIGSIS